MCKQAGGWQHLTALGSDGKCCRLRCGLRQMPLTVTIPSSFLGEARTLDSVWSLCITHASSHLFKPPGVDGNWICIHLNPPWPITLPASSLQFLSTWLPEYRRYRTLWPVFKGHFWETDRLNWPTDWSTNYQKKKNWSLFRSRWFLRPAYMLCYDNICNIASWSEFLSVCLLACMYKFHIIWYKNYWQIALPSTMNIALYGKDI